MSQSTHNLDQVISTIRAHLEVADAMVVQLPGPSPAETVVVAPVGFLTGLEVRRLLLAELDPSAVPTSIAIVPELWRQDDGTPDLVRIRDYLARSGSVYGFEPAADDTERRLAALWQRVLGGPEVGVHDDFIDAGGDSMTAVELITAVAEEFGVELSLEDPFEDGSLRRLAERIRLHGAGAPVELSSGR